MKSNVVKKIYKSNYFPFFVLLILFLLLLSLCGWQGDDIGIRARTEIFHMSIDYYKKMVMGWSSRVIINTFVEVITVNFGLKVWVILTGLVMYLLAYSISKILYTDDEYKRESNFFITFMLLMYPFASMGDAGWVATSVSYLWPLAFGLLSMISIKKIYMGEELKWFEKVIFTLALLFGANAEQMCAVLLAINIVFSIYFWKTNRKSVYLFIQTILCILSFAFHLLCPGNSVRSIAETTKWFPNYGMLSIVDKFELGFSSTIDDWVMNNNLVFIIFSFLLCILVFKLYKDTLYRIVSAIPLIFSTIFSLGRPILSVIFVNLYNSIGEVSQEGLITASNCQSGSAYILLFIYSFTVVAIMLSLYLIFGNTLKSLFANLILILGLATRIVMGFSPTIWASGGRTFICIYFSIIILSVLLFHELCRQVKPRVNIVLWISGILSIMSYLNLFLALA